MSPELQVRRSRMVSVVVGLALLAAACAGTPKAEESGPTTTMPEPARKGGTLVLGASQEPNCADLYAPCGNSSWGRDMLWSQTLPRAFDFIDGRFQAGVLLTGEPKLDVGPPQKVTYRINPQAVWSDGRPITSEDFRFTAEAAKLTGNAAANAVDTVDDTDPRTAVVTFKNPSPAWRTLFGSLIPKHLLDGKDRTVEMRDGYKFSGGPWVIDHWTKGQEIKLVPNTAYWGPKPNLDAVVFKIITDTAAYLAAYKTGQVDMVFLQGAQPEAVELKDLPDTHFEASIGFTYEFVLFNTLKAPLDSRAVRQALAYASDRDAIVTQLSGPLQPGIKPPQAFMSPGNRQWYSEPFKKYGRDLAKASQLMTGDGWTKGADGVWAKAGTRATIELNTASGNRRRELTAQILQSQWKEAGFESTIRNTASATLLGDWLPKGTFQAAILGNAPPTSDPDLCGQFCSRNIPTEANGYKGNDTSRISSGALDDAWDAVAKELDDAKRLQLVGQGQQILSDEVPALPISPVLDIIVYNSAKVSGVKVTPNGAFYNLSEWYCRTGKC